MSDVTSRAHFCFLRPGRAEPTGFAPARLGDAQAQALAELVPLLGCGEEAAALAFAGLHGAVPEGRGQAALARIAAEEERHDSWLQGLAAILPSPVHAPQRLAAARRFHILLGRGGADQHLARIAGLDAAVCTIIARLIRPGTPMAADPVSGGVFARIRAEEAGHVAVSRSFVADAPDHSALRDLAAGARNALADILALAGASFETLKVDADAMMADIRRLPDGLIRA